MDQELKDYLDAKFAGIDVKFTGIDEKFAGIDAKLAGIDAKFGDVDARFAKADAKTDSLAQLIIGMKESLEREISGLSRSLEVMANRLDRIEVRQTGMDITLSGISRSLDREGQFTSGFAGTQLAQQKAINDLAARVKRLEGRGQAS